MDIAWLLLCFGADKENKNFLIKVNGSRVFMDPDFFFLDDSWL